MQSTAEDVTRYLQEVLAERRACLEALRKLCLEILTCHEEIMAYGHPSYKKDGVVVVTFASQKNYIALYIKPEVILAHREALTGLSLGKSCIRYSQLSKVNFDIVKSLLLATVQSEAHSC